MRSHPNKGMQAIAATDSLVLPTAPRRRGPAMWQSGLMRPPEERVAARVVRGFESRRRTKRFMLHLRA